MKPSILITSALLLNTSILFGQGFEIITPELPLWALSVIETRLIFAFLINRVLKIFSKAFEIDFGQLNVFVQSAPDNHNAQVSLFEVEKL